MTNNKKVVIGLVGEMAAGKTTVTDYLKEKYGAVSFRFSDMLRDILDRVHVDQSRHNLQRLSTFLRAEYGEDIMSRVLVKDVKEAEADFIITEGIRRPSDVSYLKEIEGFRTAAIEVEERTRYERIIKREENPDDQNKTWEQFQKDGLEEAEQQIKDIMAMADIKIDNNGTLEELHKKIDEIIEEIRNS